MARTSETVATGQRMRDIRTILFEHRVVLDNAALLTIGPVVSAALGFAFWCIAARSFSPEQVGLATATLSAMNIVVFAASLSLTTTMMGLPLNRMPEAPGLVSAAAIFRTASVTILSLAAVAAGKVFGLDIYGKLADREIWLVIYLGVWIAILGDLADGVLTGYGKNAVRMVREVALPAFRVALLSLLVVAFSAGLGFEWLIIISIVAELASIGLILAWVIWHRFSIARPDFTRFRTLLPTTAAHHVLNVTAIGATIAMPLLVAESLSPEFAAAFYPAWIMMQVALMAPAGACMALYALGAAEPVRAGERIGLSLIVSLIWSTGMAVFLVATLDLILALLNPLYPGIAGPALKYMGLGAIPLVIKHHYIAVMRIEGRMMSATPILAIGCLAELGGAGLGAYFAGSSGFMIGWLAGVCIFALLMLPTVLSAAVVPSGTDRPKTVSSS